MRMQDASLNRSVVIDAEIGAGLREEFECRRPAHVPSDPPTHASLAAEGADSPHLLVRPAERNQQ